MLLTFGYDFSTSRVRSFGGRSLPEIVQCCVEASRVCVVAGLSGTRRGSVLRPRPCESRCQVRRRRRRGVAWCSIDDDDGGTVERSVGKALPRVAGEPVAAARRGCCQLFLRLPSVVVVVVAVSTLVDVPAARVISVTNVSGRKTV